jgi:cob(I)alamin adenosyltransferase
MRLYTRTGDEGQTCLLDGKRVPKNDPRVAAYGDVDELNAVLGWCCCAEGGGVLAGRVEAIQKDLFCMGAQLAAVSSQTPPDKLPPVEADAIARLEGWIDEACAAAPPLKWFVLPKGAELACRLHIARTCCRRAERSVVSLNVACAAPPLIIAYLNRLSDLLFAWARQANHVAGIAEVPWNP